MSGSPTATSRRFTSAAMSCSESCVCSRRGSATFSKIVIESSSAPPWKSIPMRARVRKSSRSESRVTSSSGHVDAAALGPREAADQAQHGRLARAAAPEHHGDLGAREAAGEAVEDAPVPAPQMDAVEPDPEVVRGSAVHGPLPPRRSHRHAQPQHSKGLRVRAKPAPSRMHTKPSRTRRQRTPAGRGNGRGRRLPAGRRRGPRSRARDRTAALRAAGRLRLQPARLRAPPARALRRALRRVAQARDLPRHESGPLRHGADGRAVRSRWASSATGSASRRRSAARRTRIRSARSRASRAAAAR